MDDLSPRKQFRHKRMFFPGLAVLYVPATFLLLCRPALGQALTPGPTAKPSSSSYSNAPGNSSPSNNPGAILSQSPFSGSVPEGRATAEVLPLSFKDALDRGLRNNLGILLQSDSTLTARGERWKELSELLPHVNAAASETGEQIDLAALGLRLKLPGIPAVVGPIGVFQAGGYVTQSLF